jgi:hypothetical protein
MLKTRTFVALALMALVGAATAYKLTRTDPHSSTGVATSSPLPAMKKEQIDELSIEEKGKPTVTLKKDGAEWKMVEPVADRADQHSVDEAVENLAALKLKDVIAESPNSYEKVGVKDDDVVKVTPKSAGKPLTVLLLGKTSNVRVGDDPKVWSTGNLKRYVLVRDTKMWRDREIVKYEMDKLDKLECDYDGDVKVAAHREPPAAPASSDPSKPAPYAGPDKWSLVLGADKIGGAVDENVALNMSSSMARLEASDFVPEDAKPDVTGLDHPRVTVIVTLKDGSTKTVQIGKEEGQDVYVKRPDSPRVWKIHKYEADRIPMSASSWRDKTVMKLDPRDVTKLDVVKGTDHTVIERVDDKTFKGTTPAGLELDQQKIGSWVGALANITATKVVETPDPKTDGFDKPTAIVTVFKKDGTAIKVTIGAKKETSYFVRVGDSPTELMVTENLLSGVNKGTNEFRKSPPPAPAGSSAASAPAPKK